MTVMKINFNNHSVMIKAWQSLKITITFKTKLFSFALLQGRVKEVKIP